MSVNAEKTYPELNVQDKRKDGNTDNERAVKLEVIQRVMDNQVDISKAAQMLGLSDRSIYRLLSKVRIGGVPSPIPSSPSVLRLNRTIAVQTVADQLRFVIWRGGFVLGRNDSGVSQWRSLKSGRF
jgi:hypothetical protein